MASSNNNNNTDPVKSDLPEYAEAPPDYDTLIQMPDRESVPAPAQYEEPKLEGIPDEPAPAYEEVMSAERAPPHLPRLAYADFLPNIRRNPHHIHSTYDDFKTLMWIVNDWLSKNTHFRVIKTECIKRKVGKNGEKETETTIHHCSAFGHTHYVLGVRLWLVPNTANLPAQQLWYVNVVPKGEIRMVAPYACMGMAAGPNAHILVPHNRYYRHIMYPEFEDLDEVLEKVNDNFKTHPLPGEVLNVETVEIKHENMWRPGCIDPDNCYWNEKGATHNLYLHILKIFFVVGEPKNQQLGAKDFAPACQTMSTSSIGKPRFEDFANVMDSAATWMQTQQSVTMKNVQTIDMKLSASHDSPSGYKLNTRRMDYSQGFECVFVRMLRVFYVINQASPAPRLQMKVFVPVRTGYREAETMSMTMARVNQWLHCVGNKIIGADTLKFPISAERLSEVNTGTSSYTTMQMSGIYWMTVIRLYMEGEFQEPPLEVYCPPPAIMKRQQAESECCVVS